MAEFLQPTTLQAALDLLQSKPGARLLAGGTDLIVQLRERAAPCSCVIDVKKIPELSVFGYTDEGLEIGGAVTCNDILEADFLEEGHQVMKQAAGTLANTLLRNRATVVGNICNASPAGDMIPACLTLGAKLVAASPRGDREVPLKAFFTGVKKHVLAGDEIAVKLVLPKKKGRGVYLKKRRTRGHDLAQVGAAGFYGEDGLLTMAFAAVGPTPILLDDLGRFEPDELGRETARLVDLFERSARPISDVRSTGAYRLAMVRYFSEQILGAFSSGAEVVL